jgi:signal transduction histidine kinase
LRPPCRDPRGRETGQARRPAPPSRARPGKDIAIPFRLSSLVKECITLLKTRPFPDIRVKVRVESPSDLILADPDHVHQVIMNLATNAADAMRTAAAT